MLGSGDHLPQAGLTRAGRQFALTVVALPEPDGMRAQLHGFFHKKATPHGLAEGQSHHGQGHGPGCKRFVQAFQTRVFFSCRADDKAACAALAVQQAHFIARPKTKYLTQMFGLLALQGNFVPPSLGRKIEKRSAHATTVSFISLLSVPRRALRTALKPSCRETNLP